MTAFHNSLVASISTIALVTAIHLQTTQSVERQWGWAPKVTTVTQPATPLALEISGLEHPNRRVPVSTNGKFSGGLSRNSFISIASPPAKPVTGVIYEVESNRDRVKIQTWAMFNDLQHPEWWKNRQQESLGVFDLQEGKSITLEKLTAYGIKPISIKVISAPVVTIPLDAVQIRKLTRSIEFVSIRKHLDQMIITLRNTSDKLVAAYSIRFGFSEDTTGGILRQFPPNEYIAPHGEFLTQLWLFPLEQKTPQGWVVLPESQPVLAIDLIIFSDGSFEGDKRRVHRLLVARDGRRKEFSLARAALTKMIQLNDHDLLTAWEDFKIRISEYPQEEKARRGKTNSSPEDGDIFWVFHQGMYDGRNHIQSMTDQLSSRLAHLSSSESKTQEIRRTIVTLIADIDNWSRSTL